jgi:hypothetical protein
MIGSLLLGQTPSVATGLSATVSPLLRGTPAAVAGEAAAGIETLYRRPDAGGHSRGAPGRVEEDVPFGRARLV